jgi:hypothetical protein
MNMISTSDGMRIAPSAPVTAYKTYQIVAPVSSHFRDATCAEVECDGWRHGWRTIVPTESEQALYIRAASGRAFTEELLEGGLAQFTFKVGQQCFSGPHKVRLERPENFLVRDGDWRGNPTGRLYRHTNAGFWQEDFAEHQDKISNAIERG